MITELELLTVSDCNDYSLGRTNLRIMIILYGYLVRFGRDASIEALTRLNAGRVGVCNCKRRYWK